MSGRSVQCPECPFSFAKLVDAGDYHAYVCPTCGWDRATTDRRPGNRPPDVCAYCDRPIDLNAQGNIGLHLYIGAGKVHGGGEHIPVHNACGADWGRLDYLLSVNARWQDSLDYFRREVGP